MPSNHRDGNRLSRVHRITCCALCVLIIANREICSMYESIGNVHLTITTCIQALAKAELLKGISYVPRPKLPSRTNTATSKDS